MKPVQKSFHAVLILLCSAALFPGCVKTPAEKAFSEIRARKILRVAILPDMPGFCETGADGGYEGMEPALARLLAAAILGPSGKTEFTAINVQNRNILLDSGEVDLAIANFTITEERKRRFIFSAPYYTDSVGFMVKKNSGIRTLSDLEGRKIGVIRGSTTIDSMHEAFPETRNRITLFVQFSDVKNALDAGEIDVFSIDKSILRGFLDDTVELLPDSIDIQPYGIATSRFQTELAKEVNANIEKWLADGTIAKLTARYNL